MSAGEFSDFDDDFLPPSYEDDRDEPRANGAIPPPFPLDGIDLLSPPGFVGQVAAWIDAQCRYPRRRLAVASAMVTVGNIAGLRHEDARDGITANMLAFCVAASATGKEAVQQAMAQLHHAAGVHYALQGGIKSEQEILRNMVEHQAAYYIVDEIGIFLNKVRNAQRRGGAAYLEGVFGAIMSAYSKANSRLLLQGDTKRELRKIYSAALSKAQDDGADTARAERMLRMVDEGLERPFLSVMGFTTPSTFDGVMDGEAATQGFVGRSLIVNEPDINPPSRKGFRKVDLPDFMAHRLSALYTGGAYAPHDKAGYRIEYAGDRESVHTEPDADAMLNQVSDWLLSYADEMGEHTGEASVAMIRRAYEMVAKVSFILAIPDGVRTAAHVRWAFAYVRAEVDGKIALVFANDNGRDRPDEAVAARVMNFIDPDKGATLGVLSNRLHMSPENVAKVLAKMQVAGMVREQAGTRAYRGKKVSVWVKLG